MSIEGTPEYHLPPANAIEQPPSRKGILIRVLVYLLLACALGFPVWRIYQNQKQTAAAKRQSGGGVDEPPGSGAGGRQPSRSRCRSS